MIGLILENLVQFVRTKGPFTALQCDAQINGRPPNAAGTWYIAIHDRGTVNNAPETGDYILESYRFEIVPWVRCSFLPDDRQGKFLYHAEQYREAEGKTLSKLERQVIQSILSGTSRQDFVAQLNAIIDADSQSRELYGNCVHAPLRYTGSGSYELWSAPSLDMDVESDPEQWLGRRLNFVGLNRFQHWDTLR